MYQLTLIFEAMRLPIQRLGAWLPWTVASTIRFRGDYFQLIRQAIANHWQLVWSPIVSNKLRSIKNCTKPWSSSSQKNTQYEVVLACLHIWHTRLMHGFLMERRTCLTVKIALCLLASSMCWLNDPAERRRGGGFSRTDLIWVLRRGWVLF